MRKLLPLTLACLTGFAPLKAQTATVHKDITLVECTGPNTAIVRHELEITVENSRGEDLCNWIAGCTKGVSELRRFEGTVTEGNGKVTKVKKGDLGRTEYSADFASDSYYWFYAPRTASYPVRVSYRWEESVSSLISFPKFAPVRAFETAVDSAFYRITAPTSLTIRNGSVFPGPARVTVREEDGKRITEAVLSRQAAIPRYGDGLPLEEQAPALYFATDRCNYKGYECDMTDWRTYGQWVYNLQQDRQQLPDELRAKLHAMTDTCASAAGKVDVVRRFMGETTRYVNVSLGIGGYRSRSAEEVFRKGIGDCKALSNYFCAMLHELGLPSVYTLIGEKRILKNMPNFQQFNHVIVQVPLPDDTLWVECTNPAFPSDYCPADFRGHDVLLITEKGGRLTRIPEATDQEHREIETTDVYIAPDGDAHIKLERLSEGRFFDAYLGLTEERSEELSKLMVRSLYLPHPTVEYTGAERHGHSIVLTFSAASRGWARSGGSRLFIPLTPYTARKPEKTEPHVLDLRDEGGCLEETIRLHIPENYAIESLPESQVVETEFGSFHISVNRGDSCISVHRSLCIRGGLYDTAHYTAWLEFMQQTAALSNRKITLKALKNP